MGSYGDLGAAGQCLEAFEAGTCLQDPCGWLLLASSPGLPSSISSEPRRKYLEVRSFPDGRPCSLLQCVGPEVSTTSSSSSNTTGSDTTPTWKRWELRSRVPGLLVCVVFLFQMRLSGMWPTELVCDRRLIQKYVADAVEMEETLSQCEELPLLLEPVHLPLVGFNLRLWKTKTNEVKTQEIHQALIKLMEGIAAAQRLTNATCVLVRLQQLYEKANFFLLHVRSFQGQERSVTTQPENVPKLISTRSLRTVFWTYVQLLQGQLNFLFYDLREDACTEDHQPGVAVFP
ncbi:thrombopoietin [Erythrolamprus reginae]|uniref:thrombopoietin n=1 Tax=Erythrolamprus reginae TaxID=121349 RepID=UPI00396C9630